MASNKDVASLNIARQVLDHNLFEMMTERFQGNPAYEIDIEGKKIRLVTLAGESVYAQNLTSLFGNLELVVFVSRHSSEAGTPTLSVHTPGNLGEAKFGGITRRVSFSPATAMRDALKVMMRLTGEMKLDYEVCYEGTHHGPSLEVPAMFVELGSSAEQWNDSRAAEIVARAAMEAVSNFGDYPVRTVIGAGGTHYNAKFTRMALEEKVAFGHIIPKYAISGIDTEILGQCVKRTLESVDSAILDWKGIRSENKPRLIEMLAEIGLPFEKV